MSLADELLADLEGAGDDDEDLIEAVKQEDEIEEVTEEDAAMDTGGTTYDRITDVARLKESAKFKETMAKIKAAEEKPRDAVVAGPVEADPEYQLIVEANTLAAEIDNDINVVHKFLRDKYQKRFPELETVVPTPIEYIKCVNELRNQILEKSKEESATLLKILPSSTVMVVSVTASTTQGQPLTKEEEAVIVEACDMGFKLFEAKGDIYKFVESRMQYIAPNLSIMVGSDTAAKLIGIAGGLSQLCKMPACNILVLGAQKKTLSGFSSTAILPHTGFIYNSPLVQLQPPDIRRKVAKILAGKCTLAARCDAVHSASDGSMGRKLMEELDGKLDKILAPPEVKSVKALTKPLEQMSKKRGGRRVRKMKERLGITELRRKQNRMNFAEIEEDILQSDLGFTMGQLKKGGLGSRIRGAQVDEKTRVRMSKTLQKMVAKDRSYGGTTTIRKQVAGTASSVTFTPVQGLEIVNPNAAAAERLDGTQTKYFGTTTQFINLAPLVPAPLLKKELQLKHEAK